MAPCPRYDCPLKDMFHLVQFDRVDREKENLDHWQYMHQKALNEGSSWDSD